MSAVTPARGKSSASRFRVMPTTRPLHLPRAPASPATRPPPVSRQRVRPANRPVQLPRRSVREAGGPLQLSRRSGIQCRSKRFCPLENPIRGSGWMHRGPFHDHGFCSSTHVLSFDTVGSGFGAVLWHQALILKILPIVRRRRARMILGRMVVLGHLQPSHGCFARGKTFHFEAEALKGAEVEVRERVVVLWVKGEMLAVLESTAGEEDWHVFVIMR